MTWTRKSMKLVRIRTFVLTSLLIIVLYVLYHFNLRPHRGDSREQWLSSDASATTTVCQSPPILDDILVVIKTGASEAAERVPTIFSTFGQCLKNLMIFSDLEQEIAGYELHDALKSVSNQYKDTTSEFQYYRQLQQVHAEGGNVTALGQLNENHGEGGRAWILDKWKNSPMLHQANQAHPEILWYVFIDADTFLSLPNLANFLENLKPALPLYIGALNSDGGTTFAHGGSGYIISAGAAEAFDKIYDMEHIETWEADTMISCCGDVMLGQAMRDAGVKARPAGQSMQFATIEEYRWGGHGWCEPSWTWHHVSLEGMERLFDFEQRWFNQHKHSYRLKDLFGAFVKPELADVKVDWDNLSTDRIVEASNEEQNASATSPEACEAACLQNEKCVQWKWTAAGSCSHNWSIRLGHRMAGPSATSSSARSEVISGWIMARVSAMEERWNQRSCPQR